MKNAASVLSALDKRKLTKEMSSSTHRNNFLTNWNQYICKRQLKV